MDAEDRAAGFFFTPYPRQQTAAMELRSVKASLICAQAGKSKTFIYRRLTMEEQGYSPLFYVMLILGIVGVVGFLIVGAGAAGGM
jgi:hypothetical protein